MNSLYIYELSIQSSFATNTEILATEDSFDTVQWWVSEKESWRIRLFDYDSDIHVYQIANALTIEAIHELMLKRYSDIFVGRYDFININFEDNEKVIMKMKSGVLEISPKKKFAFWNHDKRKYSTKSNPKES